MPDSTLIRENESLRAELKEVRAQRERMHDAWQEMHRDWLAECEQRTKIEAENARLRQYILKLNVDLDGVTRQRDDSYAARNGQ